MTDKEEATLWSKRGPGLERLFERKGLGRRLHNKHKKESNLILKEGFLSF